MRKKHKIKVLFVIIIFMVSFSAFILHKISEPKKHTNTTFAMSTVVFQTTYGENSEEGMQAVNRELKEWEDKFSMFDKNSIISKINNAAGERWVTVDFTVLDILTKSKELSSKSGGAFAITIAPITNLWGITTDEPRVPKIKEIEQVLPLVDDSFLLIEDDKVKLAQKKMGIDLGGIAKGAFCSVVKDVYSKYDIKSGLISIGGNVYAHGTRPDGKVFEIGFKDPYGESEYLASFPLSNACVATSGGYERYFEAGGESYIHIFDPCTGNPAKSDIEAVSVICEDGIEADFWSTTLYVQGLEGALSYMRSGGIAIVLDKDKTFYVSLSLADEFKLYDMGYKIEYIE